MIWKSPFVLFLPSFFELTIMCLFFCCCCCFCVSLFDFLIKCRNHCSVETKLYIKFFPFNLKLHYFENEVFASYHQQTRLAIKQKETSCCELNGTEEALAIFIQFSRSWEMNLQGLQLRYEVVTVEEQFIKRTSK